MRRNTTQEAGIIPEPTDCEGCCTVPLSILALDYDRPIGGWEKKLAARGVEIVDDDLGRPAIAREDARQLFEERRETAARLAEESRRRTEEAKHKARPAARGVPVPKGTGPDVSAVALMLGADRDSEYRMGLPPDRGEFTQPRRRK